MIRPLLLVIAGWLAIASADSGAYLRAAGLQQQALALQASRSLPPSSAPQRAVLEQYCATCHSQRLHTQGLDLETIDLTNVSAGAEVWEKVIRKLRTGAMPPGGVPRPDRATDDSLASWLENEIDRTAAARPNPGKLPGLHRLNRAEYQNAIRDLLALEALPKEMDVAQLLPADSSSYGFDNIADVLFVSPTLMDRYMSAARKISRLAVGDPSMPLIVDTYRNPPGLAQDDRLDGLPFGTRGGMAIRRNFPLDGEYVMKLDLGGARRYADRHQIEVSVDGERVQMFNIGGDGQPPGSADDASANPNAVPGDPAVPVDPRPPGAQGAARARRPATAPILQVRVRVKAGLRTIVVAFVQKTSAEPEDLLQPFLRPRGAGAQQPSLASVTISGPYATSGSGNTSSRRRIYSAGRAEGGFDMGIQRTLERILVSPAFLFRIERDPPTPDTAAPVSDVELASRLSFFLWSSIPDDELLDVASRAKLRDPAVLEQQVRRMLVDERSQALVDNFAGQWLYVRNLAATRPDPRLFPDFDEGLRQAFRRETELFFESILREDRSVLGLLNADYTFVNERLARHYGIPNVYGSHFRRVTLRDENRRGLLGQGSILTLTSYATRTSPVLRGKWILENILGAPPPPPPPDVPALKETTNTGQALSMREAMVQHRANPICASCHARMDPLGFALENFDALGRWRIRSESGPPIDASGVLPDGARFEGVAGLRSLLLGRPGQFVTTVTERLLTYALGRGLDYHDAPAIRSIAREAAPGDFTLPSLILGIVKSTPFQMRSPQAAGPASVEAVRPQE
jgi:mono/diheme cytochrome c family protein